MMEETDLVKALRIVEQSRKERAKKVIDMLTELPDDFDWNELEQLMHHK
tara:strand:- start:176 stop:322 length:147 start_codon:yes stop_codon:yes gene_type:complete